MIPKQRRQLAENYNEKMTQWSLGQWTPQASEKRQRNSSLNNVNVERQSKTPQKRDPRTLLSLTKRSREHWLKQRTHVIATSFKYSRIALIKLEVASASVDLGEYIIKSPLYVSIPDRQWRYETLSTVCFVIWLLTADGGFDALLFVLSFSERRNWATTKRGFLIGWVHVAIGYLHRQFLISSH